MAEIRVPQLGESVVEATVARWVKQQGDRVQTGDAVVELETEKVNVEVAAEQDGILTQILHQEGATVQVGEVLGTVEAGATQDGASSATSAASATAPTQSAPSSGPAKQTAVASASTDAEEGAISPVARRLAAEHGIDPARISGTGPGGRVMKEDVMGLVEARPAAPPSPALGQSPTSMAAEQKTAVVSATPAPSLHAPQVRPEPSGTALPSESGRDEERVRLSRRRLTIARRLVEAQQTAAMLTTFNEIDMSAVMEVRKRRRDSFKERHGVGLGFMSFFTKAVIGALKTFPDVNSELQGEELILKRYYDIGVAVSTEEGLVVPVLRDADRKTFAEIERGIGSLATRARDRKLTLDELSGGTFTITNGGVFGSLLSTPILNPPQVGILGMHKIEERPVAVGGQVVIRPMMYVALTYDHRVVDGKEAVSFLVRVKELIEDPETLLLEG